MTRSDVPAAGTLAAPPRRLHPLTLLFEAVRIARALVVPAVAGALGTTDDGIARAVGVGLGILAAPALALAVVKYVGFRYRLTDGELVLDSGVLQRGRRVIPLDRVQNVDVRQSLAERACGVAELRIETAGGRRTEGVLSVLSRREADALRAEILAGRARGTGVRAEAVPPPETLARLSTREIALAGATANEVGLVAATLAGALQLVDEIGVPALDPATSLPASPAGGPALALLAAAGLLALLLVGWLLSLAGAVIGYHGYALERTDGELHQRHGLLVRREASLLLRRVQAVRIEESLLRRPLGLAAIRIETAGAAPGRRQHGGAEAFVPLVRRSDAARIVARILDGFDLGAVRLERVHPRARRRIFLRHAAVVLPAAAVAALFIHPGWLALLLLLAPAHALARHEFRQRGWALAQHHIVARGGLLNRITWIVPERRIQTLHVSATPFQRRHGLATLVVDTAGGARAEARVVDLGAGDAAALLESLATRAGR